MSHRVKASEAVVFATICVGALTQACATITTRSPVDQARFVESTRCGADVDESALAPILAGRVVQGVRPLYSMVESDKSGETSKLRGAKITVGALPGVTPEWLDRQLECHNARALLGTVTPAPDDPFYVPGTTLDIDVRPEKDGFVIAVAAFSAERAKDVLDRARAFAKLPSVAP